jgi:hypothetical protein
VFSTAIRLWVISRLFRISDNTTVNGRTINKGKVKFTLEEAMKALRGLEE